MLAHTTTDHTIIESHEVWRTFPKMRRPEVWQVARRAETVDGDEFCYLMSAFYYD